MGGAENQLLKMIKFLNENNKIRMTIITKKTTDDLKKEKIDDFKEINRINCSKIPLISMIIFMISLFFMLIKINKRNKIDLIHLPLPDAYIFIAFLFSKIFKIPVVSRVAADELYPYNKEKLWLVNRLLVRYFILKLDGIQILNPVAKKYAIKLGYPSCKTFLIPNGTTIPEKFRDYKELFYTIIYIGAMRFYPEKNKKEQKNLMFLIEAFSDLSKMDKKLKLLMIGDGNYQLKLRNYARELKIDDKVIFTGYQTDIYQYHLKADIFVNPSWFEGMPNTVIEAMGSNLIVFCSNIHEHRFLINDGINGILFDHTNKKDFVDKIRLFYKKPDNYKEIAFNARQSIIENFSIEKTVSLILKMYKHLLIEK